MVIHLQLNQLMLPFQSGSRLLNVCCNERILQVLKQKAKIGTQRSTAPNAGVRVVIIYFGVIAMYSKSKIVLSISVVSGPIIHQFIRSLKERERRCADAPKRDALILRVTSRQELTSKIATKVKTKNFVFKCKKQTHLTIFNVSKKYLRCV